MRGWSGTLVALGVLVVAALTAVAVVVALPVDPPASLTTAAPVRVAPVTERSDPDSRQVQVALDTGAPRSVVTQQTGIVTASSCSTGGQLTSGSIVARVDDRPVIALASGTPLWRDLHVDDRGDDVRGLQRELTRLGWPVREDGLLGPATLHAATSLLVQHGVARADLPEDTVPAAPFAWLPAPSVTVRSCVAVVGAPLGAEGVLVELPAELRSARLDALPAEAAPGARVLQVGTARVPVDEHGVVSDPAALAEVGALPEYETAVASADGVPTLPGSWELADPRTVQVVPPAALWDLTDHGHACVAPVHGAPVDVQVLGSELGQSFVRTPHDERLGRVLTVPDRSRRCR